MGAVLTQVAILRQMPGRCHENYAAKDSRKRPPGQRAAPPVAIVAGPTAGGKSALALALADALARDGFSTVIVNADSMQVYRELAILTARPAAADCARAPHRLYGIAGAAEAFSAGRWRALARAEIEAARAAGRAALIVGGSGLYIEALLRGLAPVPPIPEAIRRRAGALRAALGARAFHAALAARDPAARRLRPGDARRVERAWEVLEATGRPLGQWREMSHDPLPFPAARILVAPARAALYRACDARFDAMMAGGALEEARALRAMRLDPGLPAMKALGVAPLIAHLDGAIDRETAAAHARRATRNYAKRQMTWFRRRYEPDLVVVPGAGFPESAVAACLGALRAASGRGAPAATAAG